MHIFEYCDEGTDLTVSTEILEEQQSKFNFTKYEKIDQDLFGKFRKLNKETMKFILDPNHPVQNYVVNEGGMQKLIMTHCLNGKPYSMVEKEVPMQKD